MSKREKGRQVEGMSGRRSQTQRIKQESNELPAQRSIIIALGYSKN